jgi:hypothetical protein
MCPACIAMSLYVLGGVSAGAGTTYVAAKVLRKRRDADASTRPHHNQGTAHASKEDRLEK